MVKFSGNKEGLLRFLGNINGSFYVYELCHPDERVFYVGKGIRRRVLEHELEALRAHPIGESNPFKCNVIREIHRHGGQVHYRIDSIFSADEERACLEREAELIAYHGRLHENGPLTNLAGGLGNLSGSAPHSKEKHAATLSGAPTNNPERAVLNTFLQSIGPVESVPVKPIRQIARILPTTPHPNARKPSARCAYAIVASATAHGLSLQPGVEVPRRFVFDGIEGIVENGVARDMLKAGMVGLVRAEDPRNEKFNLDASQCDLIVALLGREALAERGLI